MGNRADKYLRHSKACSRKKRYATRDEAKSDLKNSKGVFEDKQMNVYQCGVCKGFHVGGTPTWRRPDR